MSARLLVVDDLEPNVRLLRAKLEAEYYEVITATSGREAIERARTEQPDLILLDVMMPGLDGFETCRRLKDDPKSRHIPVIMVTALDQSEDRVRGLKAGADDFLTKPIDDVMLLARARSLLRLKVVMDELRTREASGRASGAIDDDVDDSLLLGGRVLIVDDNDHQAERVRASLTPEYRPQIVADPRKAAEHARTQPDLIIVNLAARSFDGLRLCARVRSDEATRQIPILAIIDPDARERMVRAMDMGVNDVLPRPVNTQELSARVSTQVRKKRYADFLRGALDETLESAVTDALTGLNNRRYLDGRLRRLMARAAQRDEDPVSVLICDIDHFKTVNDTWGHDAGDEILRQFADRLKQNVRAIDLVCRYGGEEFLIVMPETTLDFAAAAAERFRRSIDAAPFRINGGARTLEVTTSIGVAQSESRDELEDLIKRADSALYAAKKSGRNRVKVKLGGRSGEAAA